MNQWWVIVEGRAFLPSEIRAGKAYNGLMWEHIGPTQLPAKIERCYLDIAMQVVLIYQEMSIIRRMTQ
jgi:hypothetical protein